MSQYKGQYTERQGKRVGPIRLFRFWRNADADTLRQAAAELDALWRLRAEQGACDSLGGAEYERVVLAPRLRRLADTLEVSA